MYLYYNIAVFNPQLFNREVVGIYVGILYTLSFIFNHQMARALMFIIDKLYFVKNV